YWGRGYAFEAATAALGTAFATLGWPRAVSLIAPPNLRSIRLAERLGATFERNLVVRGHEVSLYAVRRRTWQSWRDRERLRTGRRGAGEKCPPVTRAQVLLGGTQLPG